MCALVTRRLGPVLAAALCQLSFPERGFADPETVARFQREYPQAGKRIEEVYSHIAISSRCRYFEGSTFQSEMMFNFLRDGSRFRLIKEMLTRHNSPFGAREALLMNDSYYFMATRRDPASETILGIAKPATGSRGERPLTLCFEAMEPPPLNLYGFHYGYDWSYRFVDMFDWKAAAQSSEPVPETLLGGGFPATVVDAETVEEDGKEVVKLHCKTNHGDIAEFTFSPSDHWVMVAYRVERPETAMFNGKHEFEGSYQSIPLIKSCQYSSKWKPQGKEEFRETSLKAEVMFIEPERELSASLFEPESIGVRFSSPTAESESGLRWPWVLLAGSFFALIVGLYLGRWARQSNVTQAASQE